MTDTTDLRPHIRKHLEAGDKSGGVIVQVGEEVVIHELAFGLIYGRAGEMSARWTAQGRVLTAGLHDAWNLIPRPAPKRRVSGWVNVYSDGDGGCVLDGGYPTRAHADRRASADRIACIEIDVEEGEGL